MLRVRDGASEAMADTRCKVRAGEERAWALRWKVVIDGRQYNLIVQNRPADQPLPHPDQFGNKELADLLFEVCFPNRGPT